MKKLMFFIALLIPSAFVAQSIERQIIGAVGGHSATASIQVTSTLGEPIITKGLSGTIVLTQGFHQPDDLILSVDKTEIGFALIAYPNPTSGSIILEFDVNSQVSVLIELIDLMGKKYPLPENELTIAGKMKYVVNLSSLVPGSYFVRLTNASGTLNNSIKVQKVR